MTILSNKINGNIYKFSGKINRNIFLYFIGEKAVSAYFSEDAYTKAAEPKELFVVPGATHVDLYDRPEYLKITLPKLDAFFRQYLK